MMLVYFFEWFFKLFICRLSVFYINLFVFCKGKFKILCKKWKIIVGVIGIDSIVNNSCFCLFCVFFLLNRIDFFGIG